MDRRNLYAGDLQIDYFSESYSRFEEDFQRYSNMSVPLTFLTDDILRTMVLCHTNYFRLNQENAKDGRNHYFVFKVKQRKEMKNIRIFEYSHHSLNKEISVKTTDGYR